MAQIDANATPEQIAQMEREFARKREAASRRRASEMARLSEERSAVDENATTWNYVVVDGCCARICSCETQLEELVVPEEIDGFPVREIDAEALSHLDSPRSIVCASGIRSIGPYAFRGCSNLARLVLPAAASTYLSSWIALCPKMEELVLPGSLEVLGGEVFACSTLKRLKIGEHTRAIKPGAFGKSVLDAIEVDSRNRHLATDGVCVYTSDRLELVALARKVATYDVASTCRRIGEKAFAGAGELQRVGLPEGLEVIGPFAFASSGIGFMSCPASLRAIEPKAFLRCLALRQVSLNEGLVEIGDEAFAGSALEGLCLPASVAGIGKSITARSKVRHAGPAATYSIHPRNDVFFADERGCLYRRAADGVHVAQMLEPTVESYDVREGTVAIDEKAFAYHASMESVSLPEGLKSIGDSAFEHSALSSVTMHGVKRIGSKAFAYCSSLRQAILPDCTEYIAPDAFEGCGGLQLIFSDCPADIHLSPEKKMIYFSSGDPPKEIPEENTPVRTADPDDFLILQQKYRANDVSEYFAEIGKTGARGKSGNRHFLTGCRRDERTERQLLRQAKLLRKYLGIRLELCDSEQEPIQYTLNFDTRRGRIPGWLHRDDNGVSRVVRRKQRRPVQRNGDPLRQDPVLFQCTVSLRRTGSSEYADTEAARRRVDSDRQQADKGRAEYVSRRAVRKGGSYR